MHQLNIKVEVFKEDDLYVALCPSLNVSSFGESIDEAKKSLVEAVKIFIEECSEMGTLDEVLEESGFTRKDQDWLPRQAVSEEHLALVI
jgi:predicted RNase H-like HicB family nuclease